MTRLSLSMSRLHIGSNGSQLYGGAIQIRGRGGLVRRLDAALDPFDDIGAGGGRGREVKVGLAGTVVQDGEQQCVVAEPVDEVVVVEAGGVLGEEDGIRGAGRIVDDEEGRVGQAYV